MTTPTVESAPGPERIWPATYRYCASLARFGLSPTQCLAGAGRRYNQALTRLAVQTTPGGPRHG